MGDEPIYMGSSRNLRCVECGAHLGSIRADYYGEADLLLREDGRISFSSWEGVAEIIPLCDDCTDVEVLANG